MLKFYNFSCKNKNQKEYLLNDINITFYSGDFIGIIGKSGIGKTTLLNSIIKNNIESKGKIFFEDQDIDNFSKKELNKYRKKIGWITQSNLLIEELTVFDNVKLMLEKYHNNFFKFFKILKKDDKLKIFTVIEKLGLKEKCFTKVKNLSGGQQKMVQLAKILVNDYKIILADEPTSNLDLKTAIDFFNILKDISKINNILVLVTIHDVEQLKYSFNDVLVVKNNKIEKIKNISKISIDELLKIYE